MGRFFWKIRAFASFRLRYDEGPDSDLKQAHHGGVGAPAPRTAATVRESDSRRDAGPCPSNPGGRRDHRHVYQTASCPHRWPEA